MYAEIVRSCQDCALRRQILVPVPRGLSGAGKEKFGVIHRQTVDLLIADDLAKNGGDLLAYIHLMVIQALSVRLGVSPHCLVYEP